MKTIMRNKPLMRLAVCLIGMAALVLQSCADGGMVQCHFHPAIGDRFYQVMRGIDLVASGVMLGTDSDEDNSAVITICPQNFC